MLILARCCFATSSICRPTSRGRRASFSSLTPAGTKSLHEGAHFPICTQPCSCTSSRSAPCSTPLGAHPCSPRAAACCLLSGPQPCAWLLGLRGRLRGAAAVAACRVLGGSAPPCRSNRRRGHLRGAAAVAVCRVLGAGVIAGVIAGCTCSRGAARRDTRRSERPWLCVCV